MANYPPGWSNKGIKGHTKRNFDETKNYYRVFQEKAVPVLDSDINEAKEIEEYKFNRFVHDLFPYYFHENSFKIVECGVDNDFRIMGGIARDHRWNARAYINGMVILLPEHVLYSTQPNPQPTLSPPLTGTRIDVVYLDVYLKELDYTDDPDLIGEYGGGSTTGTGFTTRLKIDWSVKVAEGSRPVANYIDADGLFHTCVILAEIERDTSNQITNSMITDKRQYTNICPKSGTYNHEPFALTDGMQLNVKIDNETPAQTVTFHTADFNNIAQATADEVASVLGRDLKGADVYVSNAGGVIIQSKKSGNVSFVEVTGGTANAALNFNTNQGQGRDGTLRPKFFSKEVIEEVLNEGSSTVTGSIVKSRETQTGNQATDQSGVGSGPWRFTLANPYVVGSDDLYVYNGVLLTKGQDYNEVDSTHIDLLYLPNTDANFNFIVFKQTPPIRENQLGNQATDLSGSGSGPWRFTLSNPYQLGKMEMYVGGVLLTNNIDYNEVDTTHVDLLFEPNTDANVVFKIYNQ